MPDDRSPDVIEPGAGVVIAGGGLMGAQIGLEYALGGYPTVLVNRTREAAGRAMDRVGAAARTLERQGLVSGRQAAEALSRVSAETDLERACERAAWSSNRSTRTSKPRSPC